MVKKGKGKKGKKGGKKGKKKESLSNLDRQKFLLEISSLENKIEWRRQLCEIIEENIDEYKEVYETELQDKKDAVSLLEEAIKEQTSIWKKLKQAIPDAKSFKIQTQETHTIELAARFIQVSEEKSAYDAQLEIYRKKLKSLENYNAQKIEQIMQEMAKQLNAEDEEDILNKITEKGERREDVFRKDMQEILKEMANTFQNSLKGRVDESFERVVEETRWWNDKVNSLRVMFQHLDEANRKREANLKLERKKLSSRRAASLQATVRLQQQKAMISALQRRIEEQSKLKNINLQMKREREHLNNVLDQTMRILETEKQKLKTAEILLESNEMEIKDLEQVLSDENQFGHHLAEVIQAAHSIILDEVRHSLIVTYDGPREKKNALMELEMLFCEATKRIYENRTSKTLHNVQGVRSLIGKK